MLVLLNAPGIHAILYRRRTDIRGADGGMSRGDVVQTHLSPKSADNRVQKPRTGPRPHSARPLVRYLDPERLAGVDLCGRTGTLADDLNNNSLSAARAVPVSSFRRVHHDATRLQGNRSRQIERVTGARVPRSLQHRHIPSVGMPMGNIHDVRWKPDPNHIHARFRGIPEQYCLLHSVTIWDILPMNICWRDSNEPGIVLCSATYRGSGDTYDNPGRCERANIFCFQGIPSLPT